MSPTATLRLRAQVTRHLGLRVDDNRLAWLGEVLQRRLAAARQDGEHYLALLEAAPTGLAPELGALAQELTVVETYFLRHAEQFNALLAHVQTHAQATRRLRLLSAGCASGEEPYSIAMTLQALRADPRWEVAIDAVDLNPQMIERARRARYTAWSLRETPPGVQQRWFRRQDGEWLLDESLRCAVRFEPRNLSLDDPLFWRPGAYDVVFCRNVLMYFEPAVARATLARITRALVPGGLLFLGHAETLQGLSQGFSQDYALCHSHGAFYYRHQPAAAPAPVAPASTQPRAPARPAEWTLQPALDLLRQERYAQALQLAQGWPAESAHDPDALLLHAVLQVHGGRLDAAEHLGRQLLAIAPAHAGAHHVLALCRQGAGDPAGATALDQAAVRLDPSFAMPHLHLGLQARRSGDPAAGRELEQALTLLAQEDAARLLLFGGGFEREALLALCRQELMACGDPT